MDKLTFYRSCVQDILKKYEDRQPSNGDIEVQLIGDTKRDRYQVCSIGWLDRKRVHGCKVHIDIKGDKIWIQHNLTEDRLAKELEEKGVPQSDIVLGFHNPFTRQLTDYAMG